MTHSNSFELLDKSFLQHIQTFLHDVFAPYNIIMNILNPKDYLDGAVFIIRPADMRSSRLCRHLEHLIRDDIEEIGLFKKCEDVDDLYMIQFPKPVSDMPVLKYEPHAQISLDIIVGNKSDHTMIVLPDIERCSVYILGPKGAGKTNLINVFKAESEKKKKKIVIQDNVAFDKIKGTRGVFAINTISDEEKENLLTMEYDNKKIPYIVFSLQEAGYGQLISSSGQFIKQENCRTFFLSHNTI